MDGIFICIGLVLFSVFGSCVKWLQASKTGSVTLLVLGVEATTAAFAGGLIFNGYLWLQCHTGLAFALAGLAGYSGQRAIDLVGKQIVKYAGLTENKKTRR